MPNKFINFICGLLFGEVCYSFGEVCLVMYGSPHNSPPQMGCTKITFNLQWAPQELNQWPCKPKAYHTESLCLREGHNNLLVWHINSFKTLSPQWKSPLFCGNSYHNSYVNKVLVLYRMTGVKSNFSVNFSMS